MTKGNKLAAPAASPAGWTRGRVTRGRNRSSRELSPDIADIGDMHVITRTPARPIRKNGPAVVKSLVKSTPRPTRKASARARTAAANANANASKGGQKGDVYVSAEKMSPPATKGKRKMYEDVPVSPTKVAKVVSSTHPEEYEPAGSVNSLPPDSDRSDSSDIDEMDSPSVPFNIYDGFENLEEPIMDGDQLLYHDLSGPGIDDTFSTDKSTNVGDIGVDLLTPSPSPPETLPPVLSPQSPAITASPPPRRSPPGPIMVDDIEATTNPDDRVLQHLEARNFERPGKLISIKLWNFMNHSIFEKEWHPNVNYIIGDNGSGKSAILNGILLGLGAKSSATDRGTSVAGFIQHHAPSCKIEVALTNDGSLDFNRYGDKIVVRRHIDSRGVSKYQIKTPDNKMRPLDRKEYDRIKLALQIMPDNPLQFLNQETSKNFLRTVDPKRMYNYFYSALLLHDSEDLLKKIANDLENTALTLKGKKKGWEELEARAIELKKEYDMILSMETANEKIIYLEREGYWAGVIHLERKCKHAEKGFNNIDEKVQTIKKEIKEVMHEKESLKSGLESEASGLKRINQALRNTEADKEQKRREITVSQLDLTENRVKIKECDKIIGDNTKAVTALRDKVAKLQKEVEASYERRRTEVDTKRTSLEKKDQALSERIQVLSDREQELMQEVENCENIERSDRFESIELIKRRRSEKQRELNNIMKAKSTPYDRFGVHMEKLINKMKENRHKFKHFPKGPQGMLYTVKPQYEKYTALIEFILYSSLYQFKVSTQEDYNLMNQLIREVYGAKEQPRVKRATLFLTEEYTGRYNLSLSASCQYPTVLDVLDIVDDDPAVINWLADGRGAERILLFPDFREACEIMKSIQTVPKTCTQGYTLDCRLLTPAPDYRCYVKNVMRTASIVQTTRFDKTAGIQEDLRQMDAEMDSLNRELKHAQANTQVARKRLNQVRKELTNLKKDHCAVKTELGQLETAVNYAPDVASHMDDMHERTEEMKLKMEEKEYLKVRIKEQEVILAKATGELKVIEQELWKLQNEASTIEDRTGSVETKRNELSVKIKRLEGLLSKLLNTREGIKTEMDEFSSALKKKAKDRLSKTKRLETTRDAEEIKQEIDSLKMVLNKNKNRLKQKDEIFREWKNAQKTADSVGEEIRICEQLIKALAPTLKLQQDHFKRKKNEYGNTLQTCFHSLITARQYGGSLVIDHNDRTLVYFVSRDNLSEARAMSNFNKTNLGDLKTVNRRGIKDFTSALSGGERSFATICFMISLWQTMEAPFFVLDEFDVFMDPFNRKASQNIITGHTKNQREAQFFFITPLSLDFMHPSEYTSVLRLYPPVRDITNEQSPKAAEPEDSAQQGPSTALKRPNGKNGKEPTATAAEGLMGPPQRKRVRRT